MKILPHYTYSDYCIWEGRWELIEGIPYAMAPAPVPRHQWICANILSELRFALKKAGCSRCRVYDFIDFVPYEDTVLQPDALVVYGTIEEKFLDFPPALVVEILSPSTTLKDRNSKYSIYEAQKIPYYLIVDTDTNTVEIYKLNAGQNYQPEQYDAAMPYTFQLENDCHIEVTLNNIWQ